MSAETEVYAALSGHAGLTAIVSTRIYPDVLPEKTIYPAVVFSRESTNPIRSISGHYFGADVSLQVGCWGNTRTEADAAGTQAEAALIASGMFPRGKNSGYDPETDLYASIIEVEILEQ